MRIGATITQEQGRLTLPLLCIIIPFISRRVNNLDRISKQDSISMHMPLSSTTDAVRTQCEIFLEHETNYTQAAVLRLQLIRSEIDVLTC